MNILISRTAGLFTILLLLSSLGGCAGMTAQDDPRDPYEQLNRSTYQFNTAMDESVFHPVGRFYQAITPRFLDRGISNFFSNLNDIIVIINDFLQFKIEQGFADIARFLFNSTLGLAGLVDVATEMGLPKHNEDFGQTLAVWGVGSGPYLIVPFLGPSTIRDAAGYGVDSALLSPLAYVPEPAHQAGLLTMNYVDYKADLLGTGNLIAEAALDEYEFVKSAYFNRRENQIHDSEAAVDDGFGNLEDPATFLE